MQTVPRRIEPRYAAARAISRASGPSTFSRAQKPGDLPVEQAAKLELAINRKTAKAIGLTLPVELLRRADMVIE